MTGEPPTFVPSAAMFDPHHVARLLKGLRLSTNSQRERWLVGQWESNLARIAYPTFEHFEEAVERELRELRRADQIGQTGANPERPSAPAHEVRVKGDRACADRIAESCRA